MPGESYFTSSEQLQCFVLRRVNSPHVQFLSKEKVVVEVSDGTVHCVAVSHLHHGCPRFTLHKLHLQKETRLTSFQQHSTTLWLKDSKFLYADTLLGLR